MKIMDILSNSKTAAGDKAYRVLNIRVSELFWERTEDIYQKASSLVITGKPSQLMKQILKSCMHKEPTTVRMLL